MAITKLQAARLFGLSVNIILLTNYLNSFFDRSNFFVIHWFQYLSSSYHFFYRFFFDFDILVIFSFI